MQKFFDTITDPNGTVQPNVSVAVTLTGTTTPAALYSANSLSSAIVGNVVKSDNNGNYFFYAADGKYDLTMSGAGIQTRTRTDVELQDLVASKNLRVVTPAWSAAMTVDWSVADVVRITLGGNPNFTFSGATDGQLCTLQLTQDATGSRVAPLPANVTIASGLPVPVLSTLAGLMDEIGMRYNALLHKYQVIYSTSGFAAAAPLGVQFYVATTGNDANVGSFASPFLSIAKAAQVAVPGCTINVASGNYPGPIYITSGAGSNSNLLAFGVANGTAGQPITIKSTVQYGAKIIPMAGVAGTGSGSNCGLELQADYWIIDGFEFDASSGYTGAGTTWTLAGCTEWPIGILLRGNHCTAIRNKVHDLGRSPAVTTSGGAGLECDYATGGGTYCTFDSNRSYNIGGVVGSNQLVHGIYFAADHGTAINNICYANSSDGITSWHGANNLKVWNNTCFNNRVGLIMGSGGPGAAGGGMINSSFVNNLTQGNLEAGFESEGLMGAGNVVDHNLFYETGASIPYYIGSTGTVITPTNTLTTNPVFTSYVADGSGDYHLQATSPARNTGVNTGAPSLDFDGNPRPLGGTVDMGCYERS